LKDNEPHLLATLALSFSLSLLVNGVLNIILAHVLKFAFSKWEMIGLLLLILLLFSFFLHRNGMAKKIVEEQPKLFNSHKLSKVITIIFFVVTTSFLFWEAGYVGTVLGTR
jgi:ABC-type iron transport system FetAB permease component